MIFSLTAQSASLRVATFNVSMEATNYIEGTENLTWDELSKQLNNDLDPQIKNIAEIIQRVNPDIILLNEFDYSPGSKRDIANFMSNYLLLSQNDNEVINYPFFYSAGVNTGVDSGVDLDHDGTALGTKGDAFGFGLFPGHYGMLVLSKYPIQYNDIRTFQKFLWKDMPNSLLPTIKDQAGNTYYNQQAQQILRLSSKSHWDIPIKIGDKVIHVLASHPTPPVFDGPENRNGKRNHDEIRFWTDYISGGEQANYIYDDNSNNGGLKDEAFVILGDLNASADEGDGIKNGIKGLLEHPLVNGSVVPQSVGAKLHTPNNPYAPSHTAGWAMRADYVLPSSTLKVKDSGVFWPTVNSPLYRLIKDRKSSSDHRLVWVDINLN